MNAPERKSPNIVNRRPSSLHTPKLCFLLLFGAALTLPGAASATKGKKTDLHALKAQYKRPKTIPHPENNAYTKERSDLGRTLYFDPRLSRSGLLSCATCHNPAFSFGDGLPKGIGHGMKELDRRSPTLLNLAWATSMFWDGRATTLEEQALSPIQSTVEMNLPLHEMEKRIQNIKGYAPLFSAAYPGEKIDRHTVTKAIAVYERTIVSPTAPFDRWIQGDESAISKSAQRGFVIFNTSGKCSQCHAGWRFTDDAFYDIGLDDEDLGRGHILPGIEAVEHAFKTPTLRDAERRGPFMHAGSLTTLEEVVEYYNHGGIKRPSRSEHIGDLGLSPQDRKDLVAFLKTLTSPPISTEIPILPH